MKELFTLNGTKVHHYNGVYVGDIYQEVDGFYVYVPDYSGGGYSASALQYIVNMLNTLNEPIEKE